MGQASDALVARAKSLGLTYEPDQFPVMFWDLFGEQGHPIRATISEMGPLLLSRLMDLNDVQEGVLNIAFKIADEQGLLLLDLKDLRAMLAFLAENADSLTTQYGNVSKATIGTIQRQLLVLENQGGDKFFSEPALALNDFLKTDRDGRGYINVLAADKLMQTPRLYATFLLWLLSELFEQLPEVGDPDKPKLVFFFDEAHLLFTDAPKALMDKIEQAVTPDPLQGRGHLFRHPESAGCSRYRPGADGQPRAARAARLYFTRPEGQGGHFPRPSPELDTARVMMELGKGEALISFLEGNGTHCMVDSDLIRHFWRGYCDATGTPGGDRGQSGMGKVRQDPGRGVGLRSPAETGAVSLRRTGSGGKGGGGGIGEIWVVSLCRAPMCRTTLGFPLASW